MELWQLGVTELQAAYAAGTTTPHEVVSALLARIERLEPAVGAFRQVTADRALAEAGERTDELLGDRSRGRLHGIPVAVKELFDVEGTSGCYGSEVLIDRISAADAEAVRRLRAAGAIVVGTTRSHEFGWGITTQHATLGATRNPWDPDRVPGGSSGGSAAALATGMVPLALGSDTGGSIRIPAALCGVCGIKPTYGRVSKRGGVALAPSLDHPGPMARTVADLIPALGALAGYDPWDPTTLRSPLPEFDAGRDGLAGVRVGLAPDLHLVPLDAAHQRLFESARSAATAAGAALREVAFAEAEAILPAFASIQMAEAYDVHNRVLGTYPERGSAYGPDVRGRLELAAGVGLAEYLAAREEMMRIRRRFEQAFETADVIVTPVSAGGPSLRVRPDVLSHLGGEVAFRDLVMPYTVPQDLAGIPACAVPVGHDDDGLPVGVQVSAAAGREDLALHVGAVLGRSIGWPDLASPPASSL